jgi:hypothetical protein
VGFPKHFTAEHTRITGIISKKSLRADVKKSLPHLFIHFPIASLMTFKRHCSRIGQMSGLFAMAQNTGVDKIFSEET